MKSKLLSIFGLLAIAALVLTSCAPAAEAPAADGDTLKVINLINGVLGDKSFFDSAERGVKKASEDFNIEYKTIELGIDPAAWEPGLEDAAENEDYDVFILGTWQMTEFLERIAHKYPDKYFFIYDAPVNPDNCEEGCTNVYGIAYLQNEGSYLAGLYVGLMTKTGIVGAVGGQDIPVINDFIVGYEQGVLAANPDNQVVKSYADSWNDPAKGKELALAMYQQGADYVFQIAGGTGEGVFQAAQEVGKFAIGVDSDQALIYEDTKPELAAVIATSMLKNVDNSLYRGLKMHLDGTLVYGTAEYLGVAEGGVGLAKNKFYDEMTPQDVKDVIAQAEQDLIDGKITVATVF
ncbi:MAG: BMP family ABC transporter substrate-binding protein [Pelolinea sp.]|nr:BMP family ABC transporter substrate-binding protein [Pelolinea sp.]